MGSQVDEGLTIGQAAEALKVSTKTIRRRIDQGILPFKLVPGKYGSEYRITELPGKPDSDLKTVHKPEPVDNIPVQSLDSSLKQALDMVTRLQQENRDLAGALGASQEKVRGLEGQILLLNDGRKSWWRRIFG